MSHSTQNPQTPGRHAEYVRVEATDLLMLIGLIGESIEDLAPEELAAVERCSRLLTSQAPDTYKAHQDRIEATGTFYQVAIEGGLMGPGPEQSDGLPASEDDPPDR